MFYAARGKPEEERIEMAQEMWRIAIEEQWAIGMVGKTSLALGTRIVNTNMGNIPARQCMNLDCRVPSASHTETFFFKE